MIYSGLCIGGPHDGVPFATLEPGFVVRHRLDRPTFSQIVDSNTVSLAAEKTAYTHEGWGQETKGVLYGFWVPTSVPADQRRAYVLQMLVDRYQPKREED